MKKATYIGVFLSVALVPLATYAGGIPDRGPIPFEAYDQDGSGMISQQEFTFIKAERQAKRQAEGRPMRGASNSPSFGTFDSNSDGQISRDELQAGQRAQMEKRRSMGGGMGSGQGMRM
ncbi:MAG: EF-hand domain-containing protein [Thiomicrorhabdus sp.]|nr:EF-hand domain-containing protein [Thiomicrorhabdus sp.]